MCNAYNVRTRMAAIGEAARAQRIYDLRFPQGITAETSNMAIPEAVFPRQDGLILRPVNRDDPSEGLEPTLAHWNLTPFFHKGPLKAWKASCNNARAEDMASKPSFRDAYKRRRCIIPATTYSEWTGPKGKMTKHYIGRADGGLLFFAGLWDTCRPEGEPVDSYTMVMIDALPGDDAARFHNRQPVLLDADSASIWLDLTADPAPILVGPPTGTYAADPPEPAA